LLSILKRKIKASTRFLSPASQAACSFVELEDDVVDRTSMCEAPFAIKFDHLIHRVRWLELGVVRKGTTVAKYPRIWIFLFWKSKKFSRAHKAKTHCLRQRVLSIHHDRM